MRDGWKETTLGAHIKIVMGQAPPGKDCNKDGVGVPFVKAGEFTDGFPLVREWTTNPLKFSKLGDTLICVVGATCGKLSKGIDCAIGRSVAALQPLETLDGGFLWNFMARKVQEMRDGSRGSAQGVITKDDLADLPLGLPPLEEQKRIVDVVSSVDAYIDALQQQADSARTARNAVLHELLTTGGDDWTETTLKTVLLPVLTRARDKLEYEVLSVTERRGIIPQTEVFNHRIATDDISNYKVLQPGDIAFNPYLLWCGAVGQWKGNYEGVVSPVYECFRVRETDSPRFVGLIFESGVLTPYFDSTAIGSIVRRRRTTLPVFYEAPIIRPPLDEQKRIVEIVSSMDEVIQSTQQAVVDAKSLRSGLLSDLLSGEHEIPASYDVFVGAA
jgi:restriction endonuclease S subunit